MVAGITGGLSAYNDLFSIFQNTNANQTESTSFENLINDAQNSTDLISADDVQNAEGQNGGSGKSSSDMDLNKDGTVTIDEIMKYMELQMQEGMKENLETGEMQGENNGSNGKGFLQGFKTPINQAIAAYSVFK